MTKKAIAAEKGGTPEFPAKPLHDNVFVRRDGAPEYKGSIILPDVAKEVPYQGIVLAVGPGREMEPGVRSQMSVQVGQRVLFGQYSVTPVSVNGEDCLVLKDTDIRAILP